MLRINLTRRVSEEKFSGKPQAGRLGDMKQLSVFQVALRILEGSEYKFMSGNWKDLKLEKEAGVKAILQRPWNSSFILKVGGAY